MERLANNNGNHNGNHNGNEYASHQLPPTAVASIFDTAPRILTELKDQFHVEPKLAELLLPYVLPVMEGGTLQHFMQTRQAAMNNGALMEPTLFLEGSTKWLQHLAKLSVDMLPATVRDTMPLFGTLATQEFAASYATSNKLHPLTAELKLLIRFTWKRVPSLMDCQNADNPYNVPYYLFWLTIQKGKSSIYGLPQVCQYIVFRILFGASKGTVSYTDMCRTVSHILYLVQLGSLSACTQVAGQAFMQRQLQLATQAQSSQVVQYATPLLQKLQDYQNEKLVEAGDTVVTI
mmetsp:Transcript_1276/g.2537  ORF Transcript_1276/g.2537 Transcript_1276/m.2537 type:complete len:291 (+) Transcript_1276:91-963(+)